MKSAKGGESNLKNRLGMIVLKRGSLHSRDSVEKSMDEIWRRGSHYMEGGKRSSNATKNLKAEVVDGVVIEMDSTAKVKLQLNVSAKCVWQHRKMIICPMTE